MTFIFGFWLTILLFLLFLIYFFYLIQAIGFDSCLLDNLGGSPLLIIVYNSLPREILCHDPQRFRGERGKSWGVVGWPAAATAVGRVAQFGI